VKLHVHTLIGVCNVEDYSDVLNWVADNFGWSCHCGYPGGPPWIYDATLCFQKDYNASDIGPQSAKPIKVNGIFDKDTWAAVYDCYEVKLAEILAVDLDGLAQIRGRLHFVNPAVPYVGCGEYKPIDQIGRNDYRSQINRRVEMLFFDPGEEPHPPCFDGMCVPSACDVYDPKWYKRKPLPPIIAQTGATWENPDDPAVMGTIRKMLLDSTEVHAGDPVEFQVFQEAQGTVVPVPSPITVVAMDGHAETEFSAWYSRDRVTYKVQLREGQDPDAFPEVKFSFVARVNGQEIPCEEPLLFSGTLDVNLKHDNDGTVESLSDVEYVLHSPWGTRMANTDPDGRAFVEGVPPGGMALSIDGVLLVAG
jgi:hypothetical protein